MKQLCIKITCLSILGGSSANLLCRFFLLQHIVSISREGICMEPCTCVAMVTLPKINISVEGKLISANNVVKFVLFHLLQLRPL